MRTRHHQRPTSSCMRREPRARPPCRHGPDPRFQSCGSIPHFSVLHPVQICNGGEASIPSLQCRYANQLRGRTVQAERLSAGGCQLLTWDIPVDSGVLTCSRAKGSVKRVSNSAFLWRGDVEMRDEPFPYVGAHSPPTCFFMRRCQHSLPVMMMLIATSF